MSLKRTLVITVLLTLVCAAAFADAVIRPSSGAVDWTIVLSKPNPQAMTFDIKKANAFQYWNDGFEYAAATELASLIEHMIGAKPAVALVDDKSEVSKHPRYIAIGRLAVDLGAAPPASKYKIDGSVVVVENNRILLAGETPIASYFAMTRLAESAGCRWYMSGKLGESIPKMDSLTFKTGVFNEVPYMWMRYMWIGGYTSPEGQQEVEQWQLHNRQGGFLFSFGEAWSGILPKSNFEKHPEWFIQSPDGNRNPWGVCMTNKEAQAEFTNNLRKTLDANPSMTTISLSQDDGYPMCWCKDCKGLYSGLPDPIKAFGPPHVTDGYINFYNRVIADLEKDHPGIQYGSLAYLNSLKPPVKEKPNPAIVPFIAPLYVSPYHPINSPRSESARALGQYVEDWSKLSGTIGYYGYGFNFGDFMLPYTREIETRYDFPFMARHGLRYVCYSAAFGWQDTLPYYYLAARLNLDPYADPEPIVADFYANFFGPAGPDMRAYMEELNTAYDNLEHEPYGKFVAPLIFTPERLNKLGAYLSSAERKAKNDPVITDRIAMWRFSYDCAKLYMRSRSEMNRFEFRKASDTVDRLWASYEKQAKINPGCVSVACWVDNKTLWKDSLNSAAKALKGGRMLCKLPDEWLVFADYSKNGAEKKVYEPDISLGHWSKVKTYSKTLSEQGWLNHYGLRMWYRNTFQLGPSDAAGKVRMFFLGIDHCLWGLYVNGKKVAGPDGLGWVRTFDYDITDFIKPGRNTVVCEIEVDYRGQVGGIVKPAFVYSPAPPERVSDAK